jgi:hypothetical protein
MIKTSISIMTWISQKVNFLEGWNCDRWDFPRTSFAGFSRALEEGLGGVEIRDVKLGPDFSQKSPIPQRHTRWPVRILGRRALRPRSAGGATDGGRADASIAVSGSAEA